MPRILDELADAIEIVRGHQVPRRIVSSVDLCQQFGVPITPALWSSLGRELACPLPPLEKREDESWSFPQGWATVWDLADHIAGCRPGLEPPQGRTEKDWREAQIFVGVSACLVEALNVDPEQVVRSARLMGDLGAE
jgi:hypothetical protein